LNCPVLTFNYSCRLQIKGGRYRNIIVDITPYGCYDLTLRISWISYQNHNIHFVNHTWNYSAMSSFKWALVSVENDCKIISHMWYVFVLWWLDLGCPIHKDRAMITDVKFDSIYFYFEKKYILFSHIIVQCMFLC
jgi:hypothetical protein